MAYRESCAPEDGIVCRNILSQIKVFSLFVELVHVEVMLFYFLVWQYGGVPDLSSRKAIPNKPLFLRSWCHVPTMNL
jgi:hypothetical protein